ncbi:hypothetical protein CYMTET_12165 [Cymbomonas tetramitiformis]|uniref:Uncharacterized protein n=1 Tax=Cymbomonas tetramitiformis TaxID=36881 RepID=A0AAE0GKL9_9CHLO|nr:hypothetical protein CYMTET_12165 [Cymbomonas tetramitiformis]
MNAKRTSNFTLRKHLNEVNSRESSSHFLSHPFSRPLPASVLKSSAVRKASTVPIRSSYDQKESDWEADVRRNPRISYPPAIPPPTSRGPPPPRPPPGNPRSNPSRRQLFTGALILGGFALQKATQDRRTPGRELASQRMALAGIDATIVNEENGDRFIRDKSGNLYFAGLDGVRVDVDGSVYAEDTDADGNLVNVSYLGNIKDMEFDE